MAKHVLIFFSQYSGARNLLRDELGHLPVFQGYWGPQMDFKKQPDG
jgi:hypothetical protein